MRTTLIRNWSQKYSRFIAKPFVALNCSPNFISLLSLISAIAALFFIKYSFFIIAALFILLNGLFDMIDGEVARARNVAGKLGKFIDRTVDKFSDAIILSGFVVFNLVSVPLGIYTLVTMLLATNISANIEGLLKIKISDAVSMRWLRIILLVILTALHEITILFYILAVLSTYSLVYRFFAALWLWYSTPHK